MLSYDLAGDIVSQTDIDTTVLTYGYDATGRLVSAIDTASNGFGSLGYSYDKNGNRTRQTDAGGHVTYEAVAQVAGVPYVTPEEALGL